MTARRVVLWRHGRTAWNAEGRFQGQSDVPLDELGQAQAAAAARRLAALRPDRLVASDLSRARRTADALAGLTGLPVGEDARLRETWAGRWEGLLTAEIRERHGAEYARWRWGSADMPAGGGETRTEVAARMTAVVEEVAATLPDRRLAVLVTHGGGARLAIALLLGLPPDRWGGVGGLGNAAWSVLELRDPGGWTLLEHNAGTLPEPVTIVEG